MNWARIVLLVQAVATLLIGCVFFLQVLTLDAQKISQLNINVKQGVMFGDEEAKVTQIDLKARYETATYVLLISSVIELIILSRFFR